LGHISVESSKVKRATVLQPVFDRQHLAYYVMENLDLEREIVTLFLTQLPSILEHLRQAKTPEEWRFATHTLKGSAQAIGACKIGELARKLEPAPIFEHNLRRKKLMDDLMEAVREFDDMAKLLYP
jgi:HPt (histidine-containing phosphotransfer) domain-containing protein